MSRILIVLFALFPEYHNFNFIHKMELNEPERVIEGDMEDTNS